MNLHLVLVEGRDQSASLFSAFIFHRVEKNATNWSKEKLKELLKGLKVENEKG